MKTKTWVALPAALAIIAVAAIAAGCGDDDNAGSNTSARGNATDAAFITDMTAHHQGAIDMAELARKRAEHPEIKQLADDIVSAQEGEISVMKTMRHMGDEDGGHMGLDDHTMGMDMDMGALEDAEPFDRAFIDAMVPHHEGAIAMAKELLAKGEQPALRKLANDIITAQTEEIAQMQQWRKTWYASVTGPGDRGDHTDDDGSMDMSGGKNP